MDKKLMLIVNPNAGRAQARSCLMDVIQVFSDAGYATTVFSTNHSGHAPELAKAHGGDFPIVACIGGDGTLSEVMSGVIAIPEESRPQIGYIPLGTANDMATTLKLDRRPAHAAETIINGVPLELDVGSFNDGHFAYIAAFGAFTEVSYSTPQDAKRTLGQLAYILEGMASLPRIVPYHTRIEFDGGSLEGDFVFGGVCNSTSVAGMMKLDPTTVGLDDGIFEIILVRNPTNMAEFGDIVNSILNMNFSNENVILLHSKQARFTFDQDVAWTTDGENGGAWRTVEVRNKHKAVKIIVNREDKR